MPERARRKAGDEAFPPARLLPLPHPAEDVVPLPDGRLACGLEGGSIVSLEPAGGRVESLAETGGRPLGLEALPDGGLIVCDSQRGLLRLRQGRLETLVDEVLGRRLRFCSNAAAAADGSIWFTESTDRFDFEHNLGDILEHRPSGRLFRRGGGSGKVELALDGLYFANGVKLTADGDALILAETSAYQLSRVPASTPEKREVIAANLPGFPDNLSRSPRGDFWVAMVTPRNPIVDRLAPRPGWRKLVWAIPPALQPKPVRTVWAMKFDERGNVLRDLQTSRADFHYTTGACEQNGKLYLASLLVSGLLEVDLGS